MPHIPDPKEARPTRGNLFRKECAYCSHMFETKNRRQNTCPNCRALIRLTSPTISKSVDS